MDNVFELYYKGDLDEEPTLLSCANFGMQVMQFPPIYRAKERVTEIQIPGRSGALTQLEGIDVYEATTRNCVCIVDP